MRITLLNIENNSLNKEEHAIYRAAEAHSLIVERYRRALPQRG